MFCTQDNQYVSPAVPGTAEKLNEILDSPRVKWKIETIRAVRKPGAIKLWASNVEFQKFCIKEAAKKKVGEAFKELTDEEKLVRWATALKESLPPLIFGARDFDETPLKKDPSRKMKRRVLAAIHLSGLFMFDVDHVDNPREIFERTQVEGFRWKVLFAHVTSSGEGLRLVCVAIPEVGNIADNQIELAKALGVTPDLSCIDASRISYAPMREDVYFLNEEELVNYYNEEFDKMYCEAYRKGCTEPTKAQENTKKILTNTNLTNLTNNEALKNSCNSCNSCSNKKEPTCSFPSDYHGIPFADIIAKYWELFNGGKEPVEGDRNALTFELAVTIRSICGYSLERLMQVIPNYWAKPDGTCTQEDLTEYRQTLENALNKKPREGMSYRLKQVLGALKSQQGVKACGGTMTTPPPMPKKLPPLIKLLTKNVPLFYKPAVANAVFPALGAHLHGVKFRYWDNVEHEATFMNILIGRQSIGKGTIKKPIEFIMEDIKQRDQPNRQREAEWKQKNPGAKQKKDPRPTDICIQMLIVDANNNGQRFIYTIVDEIEGLKKVTSKGTVDEVGLLIRKAFDNSDAGQERVGADSVSGIAPLRWNFNASTTPPNARKFFYKMVNDGTVSRLDISTIIRSDDDDDDTAPILGIYDHTFAQELKPYIDRLEAANGLIECSQSKKLALDIKQENKDAAKLYESEAYRVFSYRANVIAWLKGMVLYVAHGYKWSKEIADFVRWSEQYNLWCKMLYFGQQLEKELREEVEIQRQSGPQNLLELLPDEFTKEQYRQMRQQQGRNGDGESTLRVWQSRGYIAYDEVSGRYCKTEAYKQKFSV